MLSTMRNSGITCQTRKPVTGRLAGDEAEEVVGLVEAEQFLEGRGQCGGESGSHREGMAVCRP